MGRMKRMGMLVCWLCVGLCLLGSVSACAPKKERTAEDAVLSLLELCAEVPDGVLYRSSAARGETGYCSESEFDVLFGVGSFSTELPLVRSYACYLSSFASPFEITVFQCYEKSDADRLGALLIRRADSLKVLLKELGLYEAYGEKMLVTVKDRYAILIMARTVPARSLVWRALS